MTTPVPGRVEVDPPPIEPYTYGLLSVANVVTSDGRWQMGGVEYPTDACAQGGRVDGACPQPLPPDTQTATLTAAPGTGVGLVVTPPDAAATTGVTLTADPNLPSAITVDVTRPDTTTTEFTFQPGDTVTETDATAGDWTITVQNTDCAPLTVTQPYTAGQTELAACRSIAYPVTWSSDAASQATISYQVQPSGGGTEVDSGTVAPGASDPPTTPYYASPAGYDVTFTADGALGPQTGTLTLPGADQPYPLTFEFDAGTTHNKPGPEGLEWVTGGGPFTVYHRAECNPVGFVDAQNRALARLRLIEPREVERAFSLQLAGQTPRMPLGSTAVPLDMALGALEADAALHYAGQPTLHAPRWTQPFFTQRRLVAQQGPVLRTELESRVAFGGGYYDDPEAPGPPSPAEGLFLLYATGTVTARRSEPFVHEAFDPPTNTRTAIAERTYALDHDCYLAAVLVTVAEGGGGA